MRLDRFDPVSLDALLALQRALAPAHRRWREADARAELCDVGRAFGRQVLVAYRGEDAAAFAGWVTLAVPEDGTCYVAPLIGADPEALRPLLAHVIDIARQSGAKRMRVSAWPEEGGKARALEEAGFVIGYHIVRLVRRLDDAARDGPPVAGLVRVPLDEADPEGFRRLHDGAFRGVPNSASMTREMAEEALRDPRLWREGTQLWIDEGGVYRAFATVHTDGLLDAIGVDPALQGRGVGLALLHVLFREAAARGLPELRCDVASTNAASLRLHEKAGFVEAERRSVFERALP